MTKKIGLALLAIALCGHSLAAEGSASNGGASNGGTKYLLPDAESFVYSRRTGDKIEEVVVRSRLVADGDGPHYEIESGSPEQDILLKLDARSLFANYVEVTNRQEDSTIRQVTSVLENRFKAKDGELLVSSAESLTHSLRAFPWGSRQKTKIAFPGSGRNGDFRFDFAVVGKERIEAMGRSVECWKAQLSLGGFLGSLVGKTQLWYSVQSPNYLVRSEGPSGMPGSPAVVLELKSYSSSR